MTDISPPCRFFGRNTFPCACPHYRTLRWRVRSFVLGWWPHPFKRRESWHAPGRGRYVYTSHLTDRARNRWHQRHVVDAPCKRPNEA